MDRSPRGWMWLMLGGLACSQPSGPTGSSVSPVSPEVAESLTTRFLNDLAGLILVQVPYGVGRMHPVFQQACGQGFTGNLQDQDGDSVFVFATTSLQCTIPEGEGAQRRMEGVVRVEDSNDRDPWVGKVVFQDFRVRIEDTTQTWWIEMFLDGEWTSRLEGDTGFSVTMRYTAEASIWFQDTSSMELRRRHAFEGGYVFHPLWGRSWTPEFGLLDAAGTLVLSGTYTLPDPLIARVITLDTLILEDTCWLGISSGRLGLTVGPDMVELVWMGCGEIGVVFRDSLLTVIQEPYAGWRLVTGLDDDRMPGTDG